MPSHIPLRQVGQTQLQVPHMGLGTAHIFAQRDIDAAIAIVHKALELGANFLDTAPLYRTEPYLGIALAGIPRDRYVLATKVGRLPDGQGRYIADYSRDGVLKSIENSLNALKIDHIDILHIHDADNHFEQALNEAFPTLAELRSQGVISAVGAGMNQWQMEVEFAKHADFDCFLLAGRYTLLEQTSLEALSFFYNKRISVFLGGVYNTGILATGATTNATYNYRAAPPEIMERARRLEAICTRHHVPLNAAAVQFVSANPAVTSLVIGADTAEQVADNVSTLAVDIPAAFWQEVRGEGLVDSVAPLPEVL
jgi:D-threo-aldose 1-dehydrogenase